MVENFGEHPIWRGKINLFGTDVCMEGICEYFPEIRGSGVNRLLLRVSLKPFENCLQVRPCRCDPCSNGGIVLILFGAYGEALSFWKNQIVNHQTRKYLSAYEFFIHFEGIKHVDDRIPQA